MLFRGHRSRQPLTLAFRSCRIAFLFAALFSTVINVLMLTGPLFMMQVYDRVLTSRSVPTLVALAGIAAALYAFSGLLEFIRSRIMVRVGAKLDAMLRDTTFERVLDHALRKTPNVGTQPIRDLETVRQFVGGNAPFTLFDLPWVPFYVAVIWLLHPFLGMLAAGGAVILFGLTVLNELATRSGSNSAARAAVQAHILAEEASAASEVIRAMGMGSTYAQQWSEHYDAAQQHQTRTADRASIFSTLSKVLRLVLQSAVLALGAWLAIHGEITAGSMIAASIVLSRALAPVEQAIANWRSYLGYRKATVRLKEALLPLEDKEVPMVLPQAAGRLSAEGAAISAPGSNVPLLQGVSFSLRPGDGLGVVGPTGAGKSSLARALVGVWPVVKGALRLDGAALENWAPDQLGRSLGYLPQDVGMLTGTIKENIARFDPDPKTDDVVAAAKAANVHEMILRLPDGYTTRIGTNGIQLSGGQRQRIGLARALYKDPALIVLDEPNSNLDSDGEAALHGAIKKARERGATVVVVAHRPSALQAINMLLYVRDGRQVAFGPKEEVLEKLRQKERPSEAVTGLAVVRG